MKTVSMSNAFMVGILGWLLSIFLAGSSCGDGNGGEEEENIAQFFRHIEALNNRTPEVLDEIWASPFKYHLNSETTTTNQNIRSFFNDNVLNYPDFVANVEEIVAQGNMTSSRSTFEGTNAYSGEHVKIVVHGFTRWENHKIVEVWELIDEDTLKQQLGWTCSPP